MSLPVLIDLTDHPFDAFNPYNLLQLKQTHQKIYIFESLWVKVLQIIPSIIENGEKYELRDKEFPTIDPKDPYKLSEDEIEVMEKLVVSFKQSEKLQKHISSQYS